MLSFAQLEGRCWCCGKVGHRSDKCRAREKTPKPEWAINKMKDEKNNQSYAQLQEPSQQLATINNSTESRVGWASVQVQDYSFTQSTSMRDWVLLDSDSTHTIFCNPEYVSDIVNVEETLNLGTNGGVLVSNQKCNVAGLGQRWFNNRAIANVISLADMIKVNRVTYDSEKELAFLVHTNGKIVRFPQLKSGLYARNPKTSGKPTKEEAVQFFELSDSLKNLSKQQQGRVKAASKMLHALGAPTLEDLKSIIRMNLIRNNKVTTEDVNLALKTLGPDVATIKGKTTRRKPLPVVDNVIEIPDELLNIHREIELSVDGLKVNVLQFFTTIAHDIYFRTAQFVKSTHFEQFRECMDEIIAMYRRGGFVVTKVNCDNEFRKAFEGYAEKQSPPIKVSYSAAQEHVPRAERNNRTIQERVRTGYHHLPFNHLPRTLVKIMVTEAPRKLNYFPNKHGVSKYYSPRMIVAQENLDANSHCKYACGDYVQAHEEPLHSNTNAARSLDCLYLRPTSKSNNGHDLLHLQTNKIVTRSNITPVAINQ